MYISVLYYRYRNLGQLGSHVTSHTFFLLLDLMQFFDHYHAKSNEVALQVKWIRISI